MTSFLQGERPELCSGSCPRIHFPSHGFSQPGIYRLHPESKGWALNQKQWLLPPVEMPWPPLTQVSGKCYTPQNYLKDPVILSNSF